MKQLSYATAKEDSHQIILVHRFMKTFQKKKNMFATLTKNILE